MAFEQEGEPEGNGGAVRRAEDGCWALQVNCQFCTTIRETGEVGEEGGLEGLNGGELTERRFRLSSR